MIEALGNEPPASNERIPENQCGVVPDETVAHGGRVAHEHGGNDNEDGEYFFHDERRRINKVRV